MQFEKSLDKSEEGYRALSWLVYWGSFVLDVISFIEAFQPVAIFLYIVLLVLAFIRKGDASQSIYGSHLQNFTTVSIVGIIALIPYSLLALTGVGLIIALPLIIVVMVWSIYRIIKGMLRLKENRSFNEEASPSPSENHTP